MSPKRPSEPVCLIFRTLASIEDALNKVELELRYTRDIRRGFRGRHGPECTGALLYLDGLAERRSAHCNRQGDPTEQPARRDATPSCLRRSGPAVDLRRRQSPVREQPDGSISRASQGCSETQINYRC